MLFSVKWPEGAIVELLSPAVHNKNRISAFDNEEKHGILNLTPCYLHYDCYLLTDYALPGLRYFKSKARIFRNIFSSET